MRQLATALTLLVAALHCYFLVLEMFLWERPTGRRIFRTTAEFAAASKTLAANQGLYNGFLAAGLVWSLALGTAGTDARIFFLVCVVLAGLYGGYTVSRRIILVQALPAALALVATCLS
jgi:putative membrane protein